MKNNSPNEAKPSMRAGRKVTGLNVLKKGISFIPSLKGKKSNLN